MTTYARTAEEALRTCLSTNQKHLRILVEMPEQTATVLRMTTDLCLAIEQTKRALEAA